MTITRLTAAASVTLRRRAKDGGTVSLSLPSAAIPADSSGHALATTYTVTVTGYKSHAQQVLTIGTITTGITGITATVSNNGTTAPVVTFRVTTALVATSGTIEIPVTMDGEQFIKAFTFALTVQGASAYEIWLKTHPGKTEAEFLVSIIGASGRSVAGITEYYARNNDENNAPTSGWSTTLVNPDKQNLFLWNKETVIDDKGKEIVTTTPALIARYTENGRGIKTITEYYILSKTDNLATSIGSWSTTVPTPTKEYRYIWNYEHIEYTDGTKEDTKAAIIGVYGKDSIVHTIVFGQTVLTEGETGTMVYLDKTDGDTAPVRLTRTQMAAEGIAIEGTSLAPYGDYHRINVPSGVVYGTEYTVIAKKNNTEIARATLGVTKKGDKGDNTYLAQVAPASIELQTNAAGYPAVPVPVLSVEMSNDAANKIYPFAPYVKTSNIAATFASDFNAYTKYMSVNCDKGAATPQYDDSRSVMYIHFSGMTSLTLIYGSYAESGYDYITLSHIDSTAVAYNSSGQQSSNINRVAQYDDIDPYTEHTITVIFRKDGSTSRDDDRGYIAIPPIPDYGKKIILTPSMQNATGDVTFDFSHAGLSLPADSGLTFVRTTPLEVLISGKRKVTPCELILPVKDSGEGGTQLVRVPVSTFANGDTGNSLNWILWSAVQNTNRTFHSKESVGDTNIADIVIDDLSKDDNGIHTNRKYICIKSFEHQASTSDLPENYPDNFEYIPWYGNIATGILVSDEISTQILRAVNARIDNLILNKAEAKNGDTTTLTIDGATGKLIAKDAEIEGTIKANRFVYNTSGNNVINENFTVDPSKGICNFLVNDGKTVTLPNPQDLEGLQVIISTNGISSSLPVSIQTYSSLAKIYYDGKKATTLKITTGSVILCVIAGSWRVVAAASSTINAVV